MLQLPFGISAATDEISQDLAYALDVIAGFGIHHVELRTMWGKNIVTLTDGEAKRVLALLREREMQALLINGPIFKCDVDDRHPTAYIDPYFSERLSYEQHVELLRRAMELAHLFDAPMVRVFSFWRQQIAWEWLVERFQKPLELASHENLTLALENIGECNVAVSSEIVRFFRLVDSPQLRLIWDPGNALWAGESSIFPTGYELVKPLLAHLHIKDLFYELRTGDVQLQPIGKGQIDYRSLFRALIRDQFRGCVGLEPEYEPADGTREAGTVESWHGMRMILEEILQSTNLPKTTQQEKTK